MEDTPSPGSARAWLADLGAQLDAAIPALRKRDDYYEGKHPLAFATSRFRSTFGGLFGAFSDNWCPIVVDASAERLHVEGFRFGGADTDDAEAWKVWQANGLDAASQVAHTEAVKLSRVYALVEPGAEGKPARITIEHPMQMIVAHAEGDRAIREAALKRWRRRDGKILATVYLPDAVYKFETEAAYPDGMPSEGVKWIERQGTAPIVPNPYGVVPVVPLYNEPSLLHGGKSDLDSVMRMQDAVNKLVMDMIVASEFAAFRQRWATGIELPEDADGQPMSEQKFLSSVASVWTVEDENAQFGEFSASDLKNYTTAVAMLVQHMAAQTRTPIHYLLAEMVNLSADAIRAAEAGLIAKVRRKMLHFGEAWEEVMRLATGKPLDTGDGETRWGDPENRSHAELADALVKAKMIGIPEEMLWERFGLSSKEIDKARTIRARELAQAALAGVVTPGSQGDTGGQSPAKPKPKVPAGANGGQ